MGMGKDFLPNSMDQWIILRTDTRDCIKLIGFQNRKLLREEMATEQEKDLGYVYIWQKSSIRHIQRTPKTKYSKTKQPVNKWVNEWHKFSKAKRQMANKDKEKTFLGWHILGWQSHENEDGLEILSQPMEKVNIKKLTTTKSGKEKESSIHCQGQGK